MATKHATAGYVQPYRYPSPHIPLSAFRRFARRIAERFRPQKIILFGSYASGTPHAESDIDLLVIMRTRNVIDASIRISLAFDHRSHPADHVESVCDRMQSSASSSHNGEPAACQPSSGWLRG